MHALPRGLPFERERVAEEKSVDQSIRIIVEVVQIAFQNKSTNTIQQLLNSPN